MTELTHKGLIADCGSPDELPVFKRPDKVLLLVLLTELTEHENVQLYHKLGEYIGGGITIKTWSPSTKLLCSIAKQGKYRDSQENIHALAILAAKSGLEFGSAGTSFLVADNLTKRIIGGTRRPGDSKTELLVMVSVRTDSRKTVPPPGMRRFIDDDFHVEEDSETESKYSKKERAQYKPLMEPEINKDGIRVIATRFRTKLERDPEWDSSDDDDEAMYYKYGKLPDCLSKYQIGNSISHFQELWGSGFDEVNLSWSRGPGQVLRDPDAAPFSVHQDLSLTRDGILNTILPYLISRLPVELVDQIVADLDSLPGALIKRPLWEHQQRETHLHFFLTFSMTPDQIEAMAQNIKRALPRESDVTMDLIPFEKHHIRSRRDAITFYDAYRLFNPSIALGFPVLILLLEPSNLACLQYYQCSLVHRRDNIENPITFYRTSLLEICDHTRRKCIIKGSESEMKIYNVNAVETFYDPEQPFYSNPPLWGVATSYDYDEDLIDDLTEYPPISIFYLTRLTAEQDIAMKEAICAEEWQWLDEDDNPASDSGDDKEACFVPWEEEEDGTMEDIFSILMQVYKHQGIGTDCRRFLCVDCQSLEDKTLLVVEADMYLSGKLVQSQGKYLQGMDLPTLRGFRYIRIRAGDAHDHMQVLDERTHMIEEIGIGGDEGGHFVRPGWPEDQDLPPEPPFRPGFPLPDTSNAPLWHLFSVNN